jgi:arginase family enzyme
MNEIFQLAARPDEVYFFAETIRTTFVWAKSFPPRGRLRASKIVIVGCPQDEGVRRNNGREGARMAPAAIRKEFYKLTPFGIRTKIFDFGDTIIQRHARRNARRALPNHHADFARRQKSHFSRRRKRYFLS